MPQRILVAGCGTGREAFSWRHAFPEAEIIAVDFSPRSIEIAQEAQRGKPALRKVRFLAADLAGRGLRAKTGGDFDLVSCHGVLSYIPQPEGVLQNLARCVAPDGALYLGVNGERHHSVGLREALPRLGCDIAVLSDLQAARRNLNICDQMRGNRGVKRWAKYHDGLLAGDVFGPLIQNLSLSEWVRRAADGGWHFEASLYVHYVLRDLWAGSLAARLFPRSRADVGEIAGALHPNGFHRLIFTRRPRPNPPWQDHEPLLSWRPVMTALYSVRLPRAGAGWQTVTFKSRVMNTRLDWDIPAWGVRILRDGDGHKSLREILAGEIVSRRVLRDQLYRLYQLLALNFTPPA